MFPGGSGRLRLVSDEQRPRPVLGGQPLRAARTARRTARRREAATPRRRPRRSEDRSEEELLGVEIEITPAGKSTKRLSLLSGGEKSMTALAFLFAVFLARPCPFYILDEVEAALDDLNLDRFLTLLRRYADRAQFIVITHQKRTMEAADWLYGVSMGGDGVSKVLSRRLPAEQAPSAAEAAASVAPSASRAAIVARPVARDWTDLFITGAEPARRRCAAAERASRRAPARGCSGALRESMAQDAPGARLARSRRRCSATLDAQTWERLEEALIMADVGARHDRGGRRRRSRREAGERRARRAARRSASA